MSGEVRVDDLDELLGGLGARIVARRRRVDEMVANVVFDHLRNESVERTPTSGYLL
jgi:hypothetical protein